MWIEKQTYDEPLNKNYELSEIKRIEIGERVRDMTINNKKSEVIVFLEDTASIGILSIQ